MRSIYIVVGLREPTFEWQSLDVVDDFVLEYGDPGWLEDRVKHRRDTGDFMNVQVAKLQLDGSVVDRMLRPDETAIDATVERTDE